jgi:outer membrane protein assembly factor BamB
VSDTQVTGGENNGASAVYTTSQGTYVAFHADPSASPVGCPSGGGGNLGAARLSGNPLAPTVVWCASEGFLGSPIVSTTDGTSNAVVWAANDHLYAYDGDTGAELFSSSGPNDPLPDAVHYFGTPIVASGGRVVVATWNGQQNNPTPAVAHLYMFRP